MQERNRPPNRLDATNFDIFVMKARPESADNQRSTSPRNSPHPTAHEPRAISQLVAQRQTDRVLVARHTPRLRRRGDLHHPGRRHRHPQPDREQSHQPRGAGKSATSAGMGNRPSTLTKTVSTATPLWGPPWARGSSPACDDAVGAHRLATLSRRWTAIRAAGPSTTRIPVRMRILARSSPPRCGMVMIASWSVSSW